MDRARGRARASPRHLACGVITLVAGIALLGVLGACGAGDDGSGRQVTLSRGASTVAGDVPGVAPLSEPPAATPAGAPAPSAATPPPTASPTVAAPRSGAPPAPAGAGQPAAAASAVPQLGTIHGVVTRGGQRVAGARVTLVAADGTERLTTTDASGSYRFAAVAAGAYEVVVYAESGATCDSGGCISASWAERAEVTLAAGETRQLDIDGD